MAEGQLLNCRASSRARDFSSPSLFQKANPAWPTQVADHLVANQILGFLNFREKERGGSFLFSKACKSLYRRRFKEIEDAPLAAHHLGSRFRWCWEVLSVSFFHLPYDYCSRKAQYFHSEPHGNLIDLSSCFVYYSGLTP